LENAATWIGERELADVAISAMIETGFGIGSASGLRLSPTSAPIPLRYRVAVQVTGLFSYLRQCGQARKSLALGFNSWTSAVLFCGLLSVAEPRIIACPFGGDYHTGRRPSRRR
jgi:hypothetical protein